MLTATATALAGIPWRPAMGTLMAVLGGRGAFVGTPVGTRVSSTRTGVMATKLLSSVGAAVAVAAMPPTRAATTARAIIPFMATGRNVGCELAAAGFLSTLVPPLSNAAVFSESSRLWSSTFL